jgi:REP element-mobilizing transposase RayT
MENHLHAIASSEELSKEIGHFKSFTARSIVDFLKKRSAIPLLSRLEALKLPHKDNSTYQVWQEGSHPQLIADEKMMNQKIHYLHNNPVRRGYVDKAADWRYSSARSYEGKRGLIDVVTDW